MYEWTITFDIVRGLGGVIPVDVISTATNAPDALIAAVTFIRHHMGDGDGFHSIHVGRAVPTSSDPNTQMPVAWLA